MRSNAWATLLIMLVIPTTACIPLPEKPPPKRVEKKRTAEEADATAIRQKLDIFSSAIDAGNTEQFVSLFTSDGVLMPYNQREITGLEGIRRWARQLFEAYECDRTVVRVEQLEVSETIAFARGTYLQRMTSKSNGNATEMVGSFVNTFQRQPDSSWLMNSVVWTSSAPLPQSQ